MKKLFLLLALVGMVAAACEDDSADDNISKTQPIKFIDNIVKSICIINWDTNGDAELSYEEAAAVTNLGTVFKGTAIISFTELAYFTGLIGITNEAFADCKSLKQIELPHNIPSIGSNAFYNCTGELIINSKIIEIDYTYNDTPSGNGWLAGAKFTKLTIGDNITKIGNYAFKGCTSLTSVTIPDSVTSIGDYTFCSCSSLTSVTIPDSVTSIGEWAFAYCDSLTSVTIPDSVTSIGEWAFYNCYSLTSVTIGDSVTTIGNCAFYYCTSLTSVTIPDSVAEIGEGAFSHCYSLKEVYCKPVTPPTKGWAFDNYASDRKIYVPTESVEVYKTAEGWSYYADSIVGYEF